MQSATLTGNRVNGADEMEVAAAKKHKKERKKRTE
jgi:hypothetical protein